MKETMISPLAYVDPSAKIGKNVTVHPFAYIDKNVEIGDDNVIMPYASLMSGTRMGNGNKVYQGAVVAAVPQDFAYTGEDTLAYIGNNNVIRENAVIIRGTHAGHATSVGDGNFIMTGARLSHDVEVGNHCIIGNGSQVSGNCIIQDCAILTSNVLMQGNTRLGSSSLVQGGCRFIKDIPPYIIAGREPIAYSGINIIGLRRRGFSNELIENIHNTYRIIYNSGKNVSDALQQIREEITMTPEIEYIVSFIENSERGIIR